jgi:hypothetical protein
VHAECAECGYPAASSRRFPSSRAKRTGCTGRSTVHAALDHSEHPHAGSAPCGRTGSRSATVPSPICCMRWSMSCGTIVQARRSGGSSAAQCTVSIHYLLDNPGVREADNGPLRASLERDSREFLSRVRTSLALAGSQWKDGGWSGRRSSRGPGYIHRVYGVEAARCRSVRCRRAGRVPAANGTGSCLGMERPAAWFGSGEGVCPARPDEHGPCVTAFGTRRIAPSILSR